MGSSSVNLIIPVQGAEGPAVGENIRNTWKQCSCWLCCSASAGVPLTSESGSVRRIHSNHGIRDTGWTADSCFVQGPHPKDVRTPLHQSCDGEAGILDWDIIALSPVVSANLAPAQKNRNILDGLTPHATLQFTGTDWQLQWTGRGVCGSHLEGDVYLSRWQFGGNIRGI